MAELILLCVRIRSRGKSTEILTYIVVVDHRSKDAVDVSFQYRDSECTIIYDLDELIE